MSNLYIYAFLGIYKWPTLAQEEGGNWDKKILGKFETTLQNFLHRKPSLRHS